MEDGEKKEVPLPAPARLPGAGHQRVKHLEASVRQQAAAVEAMQASVAKQGAGAAALGEKLNMAAAQTQKAIGELTDASAVMHQAIATCQTTLQTSLQLILKKMNCQEEQSDAPDKEAPSAVLRTPKEGLSTLLLGSST